jgi:tetratricopeptide (TPR) repeat protein
MKNKRVSLIAILIGLASISFSQETKPGAEATSDTARVNAMLKESTALFKTDPNKGIELALKAKEEADKIGFKKGAAYALKNAGLGYYYQAKYVETMDYWEQSLKMFEELKDDIGIANLLNNIAAIYVNQGDDAKGLEYALRSLELSEKA